MFIFLNKNKIEEYMLSLLLISAVLFLTGNANGTTLPGCNNGCISFTVTQGTGCQWMCNYCASNLGTSNYYFTDSVCTYQPGGCVGNPIAGKQYTCCSN